MRRATNNNTAATMTSSARAEPSSPSADAVVSYPLLATGTVFLDRASPLAQTPRCNHGMIAWARSADRHLHRVPRPGCGRRTCGAVSELGPVVAMNWYAAACPPPAWTRSAAAAGPLFGRRPGEVAGMGPQSELDAGEHGQERRRGCRRRTRPAPLLPVRGEGHATSNSGPYAHGIMATGRSGDRGGTRLGVLGRLDVVGRVGELGHHDADDDDGGNHDERGHHHP